LDILQPDFGYFEALVSEPRQKWTSAQLFELWVTKCFGA
jgi:hypothetical protein